MESVGGQLAFKINTERTPSSQMSVTLNTWGAKVEASNWGQVGHLCP